jgi:Fe2+ or Zn2+ uptake regulation protein
MKSHPGPQDIELKLMTGLREKGYKLTPQRREIIKVLSQDTSHPGAMDILRGVRKKAPRISMSTVYYTLDMLKKEGLIRELEFYDRDNRYDINVSNHINLICRGCGKIEDFHDKLAVPAKRVESKTGFWIQEMRFEYYGLCKECQLRRR